MDGDRFVTAPISHAHPIDPRDLQTWRDEGVVVIERFLPTASLERARRHLQGLYQDDRAALHGPEHLSPQERTAANDPFRGIKTFPYAGDIALNLVAMDPALVATAKSLLNTDQVVMHQNLTHIKYAGLANYDQRLHLDYRLHTLLAPSTQPAFRTVIFTIFLTDVGPHDGPFAYVPRHYTADRDLSEDVLSAEDSARLALLERHVTVPAGSLLMYCAEDLFHRGTDLKGAGSCRWSITSSFHAAAHPFIGGLRWSVAGVSKAWQWFIPHASQEQLSAVGIPAPGHPYWTEQTIAAAQKLYPNWNLNDWWVGLARVAR
jgi:Phytanoyl-CoA dioxygenase (PhyH)